jgi:glycosyltransferase involved in cell wall biosynthesis
VGEPLPIDGENERLLRTGILAGFLAGKGHEVLWWTSAFNHVRKEHRAVADTFVSLECNYRIAMLHSCGYRRNISLARLSDHRGLARKFAAFAPREPSPDVILCSMPTIELSREAVRYAGERGIPIALDIRDLWPDIFVDILPTWARRPARFLLYPLFRDLREACAGATAVIGITDPIAEWGVCNAGRSRTELDCDFPLGYMERLPLHGDMEKAQLFWDGVGIRAGAGDFIVCFFGTIGRQFDLETVIEAARRLEGGSRRFHFVLCGSGDMLPRYRKLAEGVPSVVFPGWVGAAEIWTLMRMARTGLAPYRNSKDFRSSLPNKSIEYLSAGLPLVSSLTGELERLLSEHRCGVTYSEGDAGSLVAALEKLYDDDSQIETMAANASALYRKKFTAEIVYNGLCRYLEDLASRRREGKGAESVA